MRPPIKPACRMPSYHESANLFLPWFFKPHIQFVFDILPDALIFFPDMNRAGQVEATPMIKGQPVKLQVRRPVVLPKKLIRGSLPPSSSSTAYGHTKSGPFREGNLAANAPKDSNAVRPSFEMLVSPRLQGNCPLAIWLVTRGFEGCISILVQPPKKKTPGECTHQHCLVFSSGHSQCVNCVY
ncbi:hypothetical protein BOTBODRAFT_560983 [Botryobasidium botryosum FD-172 SS1]|uniref:Uncharacterized protein n=1 Tax=Botryobasidium botryosum (strain FD-172 SS1) TaxID=930990 RepID=A0A067LZ68_BOTB1|nr:hypothetical protein BOTBODRAFT_560983 [Botryobasidium botryosum FD-172 SS1]